MNNKPFEISVTTLENFLICPLKYKFKQEETEDINPSVLMMGTIFHLGVQSVDIAKLLSNKYPFTTDEAQKLNELLRHCQRFPKANCYELQLKTTISTPIGDLNLTGHIDEVHILQEDDKDHIGKKNLILHLIDNKTASAKWTDEDYATKYQKYFYAYLTYLNTGVEHIRFTYRVFHKKKLITTEDIIEWTEDINIEEAKIFVEAAANKFLETQFSENYPYSMGKYCFYCGFREQCKAYREKQFQSNQSNSSNQSNQKYKISTKPQNNIVHIDL